MERRTRQRDSILAVLRAEGRPLSPIEIFDQAQKTVPGLGIATVYRALKEFLDRGAITTVELPGSHQRYEISGKDHHHHFWCHNCDRLYEVEGCTGQLALKPPKGFKIESHEVMFHGKCAKCAA